MTFRQIDELELNGVRGGEQQSASPEFKSWENGLSFVGRMMLRGADFACRQAGGSVDKQETCKIAATTRALQTPQR